MPPLLTALTSTAETLFQRNWVCVPMRFDGQVCQVSPIMVSNKLANSDEGPQEKTMLTKIGHHLNFYRVHNIFFLFTPVCFSILFYACNGQYKISYIDSLFSCVSAMTVCGLTTIDLSSLSGLQQAFLFIQMCLGNPIIISWVMVLIRKFSLVQKFTHISQNAVVTTDIGAEAAMNHRLWPRCIVSFFSGTCTRVVKQNLCKKKTQSEGMRNLQPDIIRRDTSRPKRVNPSGWVLEDGLPEVQEMTILNRQISDRAKAAFTSSTLGLSHLSNDATAKRRRRLSDPIRFSKTSLASNQVELHRFETVADEHFSGRFPRNLAVEFGPASETVQNHHAEWNGESRTQERLSYELGQRSSILRHSHHTRLNLRGRDSKHRGFGGFPMPCAIITNTFARLIPDQIKRKLGRALTIPATTSITGRGDIQPGVAKHVPYISFEATVGRNSALHQLTRDQLEEIGGVEYRALNALLWIIPIYHLFLQIISFITIAAYTSQPRWLHVFSDQQKLPLNSVWFSAFQVVSAYTNTGMSLVDQSMIPFREAQLMVTVMIILVLAGNTAFPICLRFGIWCTTKIIRKDSRLNETLHFLLDHPRRCFIYLFPSHQTWFLLTVVLGLTLVDWAFLLLLEIRNPSIDQIPQNVRVLDGLMQAVAVRAAGFVAVPIASLAPAVKIIFVVMMYISVYPIALSVHSTNVYEEQSLGIFHEEEEYEENTFEPSGTRLTIWSRYLAMHARKQLAFDMWWIVLSLFLICIVEQGNIQNPAKFSWFTIFNIIFELVSAYGIVGLSMGIPDQKFSFCGAMHPLSKLIICAVMLRGRHRGLPVAIDRAIMLPSEVEQAEGAFLDETTNPRGIEQVEDQPLEYVGRGDH